MPRVECTMVRNKGGRPTFTPTKEMRQMVEALSGSGMAHQKIMLLIENPSTKKAISERTFYKAFARELVMGTAKCEALMIGTINKAALNGNWNAAAFWLKARAGWKEKTELSGPNGGPIQAEVKVNGETGSTILATAWALLDELAARASGRNDCPDGVADQGEAESGHPAG